MGICLKMLAIMALAMGTLYGGELPPDTQAKFIKILANSAASGGKVAVKDSVLAAELGKLGITADPGSKVAWGASEAEVRALKGAGKLVICGKLEWLPAGVAIAIVEEGGKPSIYLHMGNISASGVNLSDAVLKIGKKL